MNTRTLKTAGVFVGIVGALLAWFFAIALISRLFIAAPVLIMFAVALWEIADDIVYLLESR